MNKSQMLLKEQQFKQVVEENRDRIKRICHFYAPTSEDQKDIYQEVLINIWKSLDSFRGDAAISTWIYRIAVNTSLSFTGKELQRLKLNITKDPVSLHYLLDDEEESGLKMKEYQLNELEKVLNQLSVIDKLLISLTLEKLSTREIADVVGITEPNVRVKIHRIKLTLRNQLKGNSHEGK
jgi:RNA polymerase sigma-70 factor (ECF subfamily)